MFFSLSEWWLLQLNPFLSFLSDQKHRSWGLKLIHSRCLQFKSLAEGQIALQPAAKRKKSKQMQPQTQKSLNKTQKGESGWNKWAFTSLFCSRWCSTGESSLPCGQPRLCRGGQAHRASYPPLCCSPVFLLRLRDANQQFKGNVKTDSIKRKQNILIKYEPHWKSCISDANADGTDEPLHRWHLYVCHQVQRSNICISPPPQFPGHEYEQAAEMTPSDWNDPFLCLWFSWAMVTIHEAETTTLNYVSVT